MKLNFKLVSPEKCLIDGDYSMVIVPGINGDIGVLPKHSHLVSNLRPGVITIFNGSEKQRLFVSGGFVEIKPEGCIVLSDDAISVDDLKREDVTQKISNLKEDIVDTQDAIKKKGFEKALTVAEQQLNAIDTPQYMNI